MPGLPSSPTSETESPTGCTKQLMSVARKSVPAAELMRPPGIKPPSNVLKNASANRSTSAGCSHCASARATRRRTSSTLRSSPLAYFSSKTSRQMSYSVRAAMFSFFMFGLLQANVWYLFEHVGCSGCIQDHKGTSCFAFMTTSRGVGLVCGRFAWLMLRMTYPETSI